MLVELFINSKKMKHIRFYFSLFIFLVYTSENLYAQDIDLEKYHRSSLYSVMLKHPEKLYCNEIIEAFKTIPLPEKYNNHDLKIKVRLLHEDRVKSLPDVGLVVIGYEFYA